MINGQHFDFFCKDDIRINGQIFDQEDNVFLECAGVCYKDNISAVRAKYLVPRKRFLQQDSKVFVVRMMFGRR